MASSNPIPCRPCNQGKRGRDNTTADFWCYNCDKGLCLRCSSHHKRMKSSSHHNTIDIQIYKSCTLPIGSINTECDTHHQQFNLYCPNHLMPCCDECISTSHSKCTGIKSLASVVEKTKIEKSKESVEKDINSITYFLDKMVNSKSENIKRGEQQHDSINEFVIKIRNGINKHLDHLEKKLWKEADTVWSQEKSKLTSLITEIEDKQKTLKEMLENLNMVTEHTTKLQSFLGVHQIEQKVHQCQQYVEDMKDSERVSEVDIQVEQNDEIEKIFSELQSLKSLGKVKVVSKTELVFERETNVKREVESYEQCNLNNMTMNIDTKTEIGKKMVISDIICLMDGRFIVVEWRQTVNLLFPDGKFQKQLPILGNAMNVTQINQDTIAITFPDERMIRIFSMENEEVTDGIKLNKECRGISFYNNTLHVGLSYDEVRIIDLKGNTLKSIQVESKAFLYYLVYCNDRIIYSDYVDNVVYCVDGSGKQIWRYTQDLSRPEGLCTDTYGNIIVADCDSDRIIVISKDGKDSKVLVSKENGLKNPKCICFNNNDFKGFICGEKGEYLATFNLSYE
ncbi:uncharacterized protein LOC127729461 [Mytilus californianus]|uniref:uncharacterized protein LOC127729461 n=1 Tax=Mytilus californianus TaxID=6549 RepID=UPI00224835B8|nr:uncharacterized protein LOC127729461 [Mytilus californianus]XP_052093243.1 uncharacterized protein LOC127729461 [Mytilus californianus]